jgi:hypothetical protein
MVRDLGHRCSPGATFSALKHCRRTPAARSASRHSPSSHTLRPHRRPHPATGRSWATFYFPQNSFVWENKKIDSLPYKRETNMHRKIFRELGNFPTPRAAHTRTARRNAPRQPAPPMRPPAAARMQCTAERPTLRPSHTNVGLPCTSPIQMSTYPILPLPSGRTSSPSAWHFWVPVRPRRVLVRDPTYPVLFPYKCRPTLYSLHTNVGLPCTASPSGRTSSLPASHFWVPVRPGQVLVRDSTYPVLFPYK